MEQGRQCAKSLFWSGKGGLAVQNIDKILTTWYYSLLGDKSLDAQHRSSKIQ